MKHNNLKALIICSLCCLSFTISAQHKLWKPISQLSVDSENITLRLEQEKSSFYQLSTQNLLEVLDNAPDRGSLRSTTTHISLPGINGKMEKFVVIETPSLSPRLQAKFPKIKSFRAQGIDDPAAVASISVGTDGVNIMITSPNHPTTYIEPILRDNNLYALYERDIDLPSNLVCHADELSQNVVFNDDLSQRNADDGMLRTFRLAVATTGEYSNFHLNNQNVPNGASDAVKDAAVISAINTTMTQVNGILERDMAITMVLIDNNEEILYFDPGSDPYSNTDSFAMLDQNQSNIDDVIGNANYDIGHVFSTGPGGVAQLNSPCVGGKARGVTGLPQPIGYRFNVNYVSHEMGHQYGATHTFNNNCNDNVTPVTAFEPGSGSTIMSYAGICPPNVQQQGDDYYNGGSITQMWANVSQGNSTCAEQTSTNNTAPIADAGQNYRIPKSTPFMLEGTATDADGDALTHSWEQRDTQTAPAPPQSNSNLGPAFRSIEPSNSPIRMMPNLESILAGFTGNTWERVPSVARVMRFRYTVRDNVAGGASTQSDINIISVDGNAGPFAVTSPNTSGITWTTQTNETVTWDVSNTDVAPIETTLVDILFSEDGGENFNIVLASNTPNDGSEEINVPNVNTDDGRIMIKAVGNIFFDINNRDIAVEGSLSTPEVELENLAIFPNPNNGEFTIGFTPNTQEEVDIAIYDVRGRLINLQNFTNVSSNFSERITLANTAAGMYFVTITNGKIQTTKKITIR